MNLMQKLDKFLIANIIANVINFQIRKHNLCELNFIQILNVITKYEKNNKDKNDFLRIITYVFVELKLDIDELEKEEIIENIINNIKYNYHIFI